jgi:hypothetical protein
LPLLIAATVLAGGAAAARHYFTLGLSLSHYDARAHLVVARRVFDSLWPSWQQIGAVWLPLPHLLNMIPVQVDAWYRTGASGIAISVLSMAVAAWAIASMLIRITGSRVAAIAAAALLMLNPNVLYLQSTPMTEPVLFATTALAIALTSEWIDRGATTPPVAAGLALAAAALTRYEAWPIVGALIALTGVVLMRRGVPLVTAINTCMRLGVYPVGAIVIFLFNSRWTVGTWFIKSGFYVPENTEALGHPLEAWRQVRVGLYRLSGSALVWSAYAGLALTTLAFVRSRARASIVTIAALAAAGLLPWYAYLQGHPFRIRYDVPLIAASAALCGAGIGLIPALLRIPAAAALVIVATLQASPLDRTAPVVVESQREAKIMEGRRVVTAYLQQHWDGRPIMISMGSLAHYMHDLSQIGIDIHDILHEGNGEIWPDALLGARGHVGWVVVEEKAEGGDSLYRQRQLNPRFLRGFSRVSEGGNVALYRADE